MVFTTTACGGSSGSSGSSGASAPPYRVTKISTLEELSEYLYVPEAENDFLLANAHETGAFSNIDLTEYFDDTCPRGVLTSDIDGDGRPLKLRGSYQDSHCMRLMGDGHTIRNVTTSFGILKTLQPWHSIQDITFISIILNISYLICIRARGRVCQERIFSSGLLAQYQVGIDDGRVRNIQFDEATVNYQHTGSRSLPDPEIVLFYCQNEEGNSLIDCEYNDLLYGYSIGAYEINRVN